MGRLRRRRAQRESTSQDLLDQGVYRLEVDTEAHHFRDESTFSFWASTKTILVLSVLLWWLGQPGWIVAGYVGGRRAGTPWRAVLAALVPVFVIWVVNAAYASGVGAGSLDFLGSLPALVAGGIGSIFPPAAPYAAFALSYLTNLSAALQTTLGMGTSGYLVVVVFAYIGGIVADQTKREMGAPERASNTVQIIQPLLHPRAIAASADSGATGGVRGRRRSRGRPSALSEYHKVPATVYVSSANHAPHGRSARRQAFEEEDEGVPAEEEESRSAPEEGAYRPEATAYRLGEREAPTKRFVQRALARYEKANRRHP